MFANSRRLAERLTARLNEIYAERLEPRRPRPSECDRRPRRRLAPSAARTGRQPPTARPQLMGAVRQHRRRPAAPRPRPPRLGHEGAARRSSRTTSSPAGCAASSRPRARSSSASTWARSTSSSRSSRRRRSPAACSASAAPGTRWARSREGVHVPQAPRRPHPRRGRRRADARRADRGDSPSRRTRSTSSPSRPSPPPPSSRSTSRSGSTPCGAARRSRPCRARAYDATLDLLSGPYPSDEFAELRPRIVWDRVAGTLTGRPGAQRLAVTSGGTIPDRGHVRRLHRRATDRPAPARRVGELDEEMVYESRVGDVFALGATSWRIQEITHDRVLVTPAFGQPGRRAVLEGRRPRPARRARPGDRRVHPRASTRRRRRTPRDRRRRRRASTRAAVDNLVAFLAEQRRPPGTCRPTAPSSSSASATSSATGGSSCTPRTACRCTRRGRSRSARASASGSASTARRSPATTASSCASPTPTPSRPAPSCSCSSRRARATSSPSEVGGSALFAVPVPRVRRPGAAAAPLQPRASGRRSGSSGSGRRSCSTSRASTRASRSSSRRCARCCRTSTTCPRSPSSTAADREPRASASSRSRPSTPSPFARVAAVRLRRRVHVRGRLPARRTPGRRAVASTRRCSPSCSAGPSCASCSTRR